MRPFALIFAGAWVSLAGCAQRPTTFGGAGAAEGGPGALPPAGNLAVVLEGKLHFPYSPHAVDIALDGKLVSHGEATVLAVPAGEHVVRVIATVDYRCGLLGPSSTVELRAAWVLRVGEGGGRVDLMLRSQDSPALGFAERLSVRAKPSGAAAFADAVYTVWSQTLVTDDRCGIDPLDRDDAPPATTPLWLGPAIHR